MNFVGSWCEIVFDLPSLWKQEPLTPNMSPNVSEYVLYLCSCPMSRIHLSLLDVKSNQ